MAEDGQRIQFGADINVAKPSEKSVYTQVLDDSAVSQRVTTQDLEERAVQLANSDLNHKKKQVGAADVVRWSLANKPNRLTQDGCFYGFRIRVLVLSTVTLVCPPPADFLPD